MMIPTATTPDLRRADATGVLVNTWYVPDRDAGARELDELVDHVRGRPWPARLLSFSCYLNTDSDTVLTYSQCAGTASCRPFLRSPRREAQAEPVEYRLRRVVQRQLGIAGCVVVAMFDVDGPERQERIIEAIAGTIEQAPADQHRGMLSANFHASLDGTRVLNYAEWTSDEAHVAFLAGATRTTTLRITNETPGVRPIGFKRYHVYRCLVRPVPGAPGWTAPYGAG